MRHDFLINLERIRPRDIYVKGKPFYYYVLILGRLRISFGVPNPKKVNP